MQRLAPLGVLLAACAPAVGPPMPPPVPDDRPALLEPGPLAARLASYTIHAELDARAHRITATERLRWRNAGVARVESVPLHLYMNAFADEGPLFMQESGGSLRGLTTREDAGWIDVPSIRVDGVEVRPKAFFRVDATVLEVPLPRPVSPGQELVLDLDFVTQLPIAFARTGWRGDFHMVGQWFPKIGVLAVEGGDQRWHCDPYHADSEFFADFGVYDVDLTVPANEVVAATGVLVGVDELTGRRRLRYHAEDVHDFAWVADPTLRRVVGHAGPVEVRVLYPPGHEAFAARHLDAARRTLESYGRLFGPYPWSIMTVVDPPWDAALAVGGMEYPTLVTTGGDVDVPRVHYAEEVTVHEVGHNWFQGLVASNEVDEAYLDEGVNEYANGVVLDDWFGADRSLVDLPFARVGYYEYHRIRVDADALGATIATPSYRFPPGEYAETTYGKTAVVLKTLEQMVGRDRFLAALGGYARRFRFRHPSGADFIAALDDGLGGGWRWFLDPAFHEVGGVDLRVQSVGRALRPGNHHDATVTVERTGRVPVLADVDVTFADGWTAHEHWDGRDAVRAFSYRRPVPVVRVEIDPDGKLLLEHARLDNGWQEPAAAPAVVAAARVGFWEQTLEELVGL
jgi:hypothetical protein